MDYQIWWSFFLIIMTVSYFISIKASEVRKYRDWNSKKTCLNSFLIIIIKIFKEKGRSRTEEGETGNNSLSLKFGVTEIEPYISLFQNDSELNLLRK